MKPLNPYSPEGLLRVWHHHQVAMETGTSRHASLVYGNTSKVVQQLIQQKTSGGLFGGAESRQTRLPFGCTPYDNCCVGVKTIHKDKLTNKEVTYKLLFISGTLPW